MTRRHRSTLATAAAPTLTLSAAGDAPVVDLDARTITGLAVPYGPVGQTSAGRLQFAAGALTWSDPRRVKLLREHDQSDVLGYATALTDTPAGLLATFHVPAGANGDRALVEAADGLRDALSVGVQLDDRTATALRRAGGAAVQARGQLREISQVAVPAFDDARLAASTDPLSLVVSSWQTAGATPTAQEGPAMPCSHCRLIHDTGVVGCLATASTPTPDPAPVPDPAPAPVPDPVPAPAPRANAGGAVVTGTPSTYTFDGTRSLVVDAWNARVHGDADARDRMARFNAELAAGNPASTMALAAVLKTTDDPGNQFVEQARPRPDLLREAIDRGRPIISKGTVIPISNATPFLVPTVGEFTGVDDHVEGTPHVAEGTLDLGSSDVVQPRAVSGAFRMSRELIDSSNPAIDRVALAKMLKDYRRKTEAKAAAAILAGPITYGIDTVLDLRTELITFGDDDIEARVALAGKGLLLALAQDVDGDGRPMLNVGNAVNAFGGLSAGYSGANVDGVPVVKASGSIPLGEGAIWDPTYTLFAESSTQTFRFEEVEGPGVIKLALFGYFAAHQLDPAAVQRLATGPAPV